MIFLPYTHKMKRPLLFLSFTILASCGQPSGKSDGSASTNAAPASAKPVDTLQNIISANISKQPTVDTTFAGFTFSMTKEQATAHYIQLVKDKKMILDDQSKQYNYPLTFDLVKANAVIAPEFSDNKLYKLSLVITPAEDLATDETVFLQASTTYMQKYANNGFTLYQKTDVFGTEKEFHWIKNNLQIFLHKSVGATIVSYINMPVDQVVNKNKQQAKDSSKVQTNKDI